MYPSCPRKAARYPLLTSASTSSVFYVSSGSASAVGYGSSPFTWAAEPVEEKPKEPEPPPPDVEFVEW